MKKIFEFLKDGFHEVSSSLDLSFDDDSVADEKIPFLAYLASFLKENKYNPCEPPAGCLNFRNLVAGFMKSYHHIPLTPDVRLGVCYSYSYIHSLEIKIIDIFYRPPECCCFPFPCCGNRKCSSIILTSACDR